MARRGTPMEQEAPEVTEEAAVDTTVTDTPTSTTDTEAATPDAAPAADGSSTSTETPAPAPEADLSAFTAAVAAAVDGRDESTGEIAVALVEPVQKAYRELPSTKERNRAKGTLQDGVKEGMDKLNIQLARAYMQLADSMSTGSTKSAADKPPANPTETFVNQAAALALADVLVKSNVPEGVEDTWFDQVNALVSSSTDAAQQYSAWLKSEAEDKGDEPEVSAVIKAAVKLSQGKSARVPRAAGTSSGSTYTGERRSVAAHILNAFADVESGAFLTIAKIRSTKSEEYGEDVPSAGAISARLFPSSGKCTIEGITPGTSPEGNKGASKN